MIAVVHLLHFMLFQFLFQAVVVVIFLLYVHFLKYEINWIK